MDYWVELGLRPLRHFADFRGRSTRSEIVAFYLLMSVATFGLTLLSGLLVTILDPGIQWAVREIVQLAFLCPTLALSVRRFHDQGKSGWWILLLLPALCANSWQFYRAGFSFDPVARLAYPLPWAVEGAIVACLLAYLALLFWKDEEGTNRYGPNPRYDEPIESGEPAAADAQLL